jgi:uncharacterized membrane protein
MWKRKGWLTPVLVIIPMALVQLVIDMFMGKSYYTSNEWPKWVAISVSSIAIASVGYYLNYTVRNKELKNVISQGDIGAHTFLLFPIEYWSAVIPLIFVAASFN